MGSKENFTAGRVAAYEFQPSVEGKSNQTVYWDGKTPGLGLRVTAKVLTPGNSKSSSAQKTKL